MKIKDIDINLLEYYEKRFIDLPRHLDPMIKSIRALGLIMPLNVVERDGKFLIFDGRLRFEACMALEYKTIPCRIFEAKIKTFTGD